MWKKWQLQCQVNKIVRVNVELDILWERFRVEIIDSDFFIVVNKEQFWYFDHEHVFEE